MIVSFRRGIAKRELVLAALVIAVAATLTVFFHLISEHERNRPTASTPGVTIGGSIPGYLGATFGDANGKCIITNVAVNSPADVGGMKTGDQLQGAALDDDRPETITKCADMYALMARSTPGEELTVQYLRYQGFTFFGKLVSETVKVRLSNQP